MEEEDIDPIVKDFRILCDIIEDYGYYPILDDDDMDNSVELTMACRRMVLFYAIITNMIDAYNSY